MRVRELRSAAEIENVRSVWHQLLQQTPGASFMQTPEWLEARCRHAPHFRSLRILVCESRHGNETGGIAGIVPLNVQIEPTKVGDLRLLTFPLDGWGSFYGPIGPQPVALLRAALEYLGRAERNYDLIDLRPMPAVAVEDLPGAKPLPSSPWARAAMIDLAGSWDTYWESRKQDHNRRRNVERCERRLSEAGCITFERYRPAGLCGNESEPRWDLFDECVSLARRSWQSGLTEGNTLSHPDVLPLLRDAHQAAAQAGALDMSLLRLNDQPLAFSYGYHYRGNFDLLRIGFDPDWAKLAPGNALWTRLIRDSFQRKDRVIDLGPTCLDFKKFWLTRVEPSFRLLRYTWSPRSQVLRVTRLLRGRAGEPGDKTNAAAKVEATQPAPALVATSADGTDRRDRPAR